MTPETINLVRRGLTSEYFLACFLKGPASGYALGQIVQNRKRPNMKTLHTATTTLKNAGYITRDEDDKFCINSKNLVKVIENKFLGRKGIALSAREREIIAKILESGGPFAFVSDQMISEMHIQEFRFHNIDAMGMICDRLGEFAAYFLALRKTLPSPSMEDMSANESQKTLNLLGPIWPQMVQCLTMRYSGPKMNQANTRDTQRNSHTQNYLNRFLTMKSSKKHLTMS